MDIPAQPFGLKLNSTVNPEIADSVLVGSFCRMAFGFDQFPLSSPAGYFADDFFREELRLI